MKNKRRQEKMYDKNGRIVAQHEQLIFNKEPILLRR